MIEIQVISCLCHSKPLISNYIYNSHGVQNLGNYICAKLSFI